MEFLGLTFCNISGSPTNKKFYVNPKYIVRLVSYDTSTKITLITGEEIEVVESASAIRFKLTHID